MLGCGENTTVTTAAAVEGKTDKETPVKSNATSKKSDDTGRARVTQPVEAAPRDGEDWPRFLGLKETGVSGETGLLEKWPKTGPPKLWEKEVGTGYSAPSIRGDRLVLHHRVGDEEIVECMNVADGEQIWQYKYASNFTDPFGYNNGPRCSPILTKNRCYTYGAEGVLVCLEFKTGKEIWTRDIKKDFNVFKKDQPDVPNWFFGIGSTPILEDGLIFTLVGGQPNSAVVAFNADTGKTEWQNVGKDTWDGVATENPLEPKYEWTGEEMFVSYASPLAATIHGKRHVLCLLRQGLVSLNPKDGSVNFKHWFKPRSYESVNAARPIVIGDKIFLSAAYKQGSALLQVNEDGKSVNEVWRDRRNMLTHWSTAIHVDGYIYGFSGRHEQEATFRCIDLKTGKVEWETTGYEGELGGLSQDPRTGEIVDTKTGESIPWPFYGRGSKIQIGDRFIVLGERGTLALVKINAKKFEELARTSFKQIGYPAWTAPVLSRKRMFLRSEKTLICLDLKPDATAK
ncbi:MAG: PQQ-binding-like beta-propeller repeat protein [Planctomycetaceae bacterium]|nr:PQQ-binding-like beta-propeller repeat protein [Planctomycetaceae bacterium]MBT6156418.1 PQQ-binding-like beta-propeller repeat protein [Planctomycetaceae bacterium]MBT6487968.1 PQQ-binding-like beta-propeller repeat protein [Planctomycetaceae bacterium]MBT6495035.1 PQQ-binding-like beta-propeller repeat protein [Planctomycetaceae bacterium]